jgi:hypothetical protein
MFTNSWILAYDNVAFCKTTLSSAHLPLSDPLGIIKSSYSTLYETARGTTYVYYYDVSYHNT